MNVASGESKPGTVSKISQEQLEARGLAEFFSADDPVAFYEAEPSEPLPAGTYLAEAEMEGLPVAKSSEKVDTNR